MGCSPAWVVALRSVGFVHVCGLSVVQTIIQPEVCVFCSIPSLCVDALFFCTDCVFVCMYVHVGYVWV